VATGSCHDISGTSVSMLTSAGTQQCWSAAQPVAPGATSSPLAQGSALQVPQPSSQAGGSQV
jgi:hypothetical protein